MRPPWHTILLSFVLFHTAQSVICREKDFGLPKKDRHKDYDTRTCEGEHCYLRMNNTGPMEMSCANTGKVSWPRLNNSCWLGEEREPILSCWCNTDFCSETNSLPVKLWMMLGKTVKKQDKKLQCGWWFQSITCSSCIYSYDKMADGPSGSFGCESTIFGSFTGMSRPRSCARITNGCFDRVECSCDTEDNCAFKLVYEQKLQSDKVTCYASGTSVKDLSSNETCTGDLCFTNIVRSKNKIKHYSRGCITNNVTLEAAYQVGYITLRPMILSGDANHFAVCDTPLCNVDWNSTQYNIPGISNYSTATVPPMASSTTPPIRSSSSIPDHSATTMPPTPSILTSITPLSTTPIVVKATTSSGGGSTTSPSPSSPSTTGPSKQAVFESEYLKLFDSIKNAVDNFMKKFGELYG